MIYLLNLKLTFSLPNLFEMKKDDIIVNPSKEFLEERIQLIKEHINSRINVKIDISEIADIACLSKFYFIRVFTEMCGCTPYQYITGQKINKAKDMLINENNSIRDISFECGYNSTQSFRQCFKKQTGLSPSEYREMIQQK